MWELFVILISLGLLMYTAYKGFSVILMAPICALLAVLLINPANVLPFYSLCFSMPKDGLEKAILTVVLLGAILTYSGVSLFVAVFAIYPFANQLFRQANIPKRLIPGTIALGAFTFTMDALPGTHKSKRNSNYILWHQYLCRTISRNYWCNFCSMHGFGLLGMASPCSCKSW